MWLRMMMIMMMMMTGIGMRMLLLPLLLLLNKISALFSFKATSRKVFLDAQNFARARDMVRVFMGI